MAPQLSLEQRVINVVLDWANPVPFPVNKSSSIKGIWGTRSDTVPFPDPATMPLIQALQKEFKTGTDARVLTGFTPAAFDTGGFVTTLQDLITSIDDAPEPQHVVIAGFSDDAVKAEFASAVADALHEKLVAGSKQIKAAIVPKITKQAATNAKVRPKRGE